MKPLSTNARGPTQVRAQCPMSLGNDTRGTHWVMADFELVFTTCPNQEEGPESSSASFLCLLCTCYFCFLHFCLFRLCISLGALSPGGQLPDQVAALTPQWEVPHLWAAPQSPLTGPGYRHLLFPLASVVMSGPNPPPVPAAVLPIERCPPYTLRNVLLSRR